jgi:hypothetical protein
MSEITAFLDELPSHAIDQQPWLDFLSDAEVNITMLNTEDSIFLKYRVLESEVRFVNTSINSSVWEDSCVEFFISFGEEGYYNFEFNCIGTPLVGFGKHKTNREMLAEEVIRKMRCESVFVDETSAGVNWELTIAIPFEMFVYHKVSNLKGKRCKGNFYKCGNLLLQPHYISWNKIKSPSPNFHLTEYFGVLNFE